MVGAHRGGAGGLRGLYVDYVRAGFDPYRQRTTIVRGASVHPTGIYAAVIDAQGVGRTDA